jgi:hypothetical protein
LSTHLRLVVFFLQVSIEKFVCISSSYEDYRCPSHEYQHTQDNFQWYKTSALKYKVFKTQEPIKVIFSYLNLSTFGKQQNYECCFKFSTLFQSASAWCWPVVTPQKRKLVLGSGLSFTRVKYTSIFKIYYSKNGIT